MRGSLTFVTQLLTGGVSSIAYQASHTLVSGQAQQIFFLGFSAAASGALLLGCLASAEFEAPPNGHQPMMLMLLLNSPDPKPVTGRNCDL